MCGGHASMVASPPGVSHIDKTLTVRPGFPSGPGVVPPDWTPGSTGGPMRATLADLMVFRRGWRMPTRRHSLSEGWKAEAGLVASQRAVAQLARVPVSKTGGWGFESLLPCSCGPAWPRRRKPADVAQSRLTSEGRGPREQRTEGAVIWQPSGGSG